MKSNTNPPNEDKPKHHEIHEAMKEATKRGLEYHDPHIKPAKYHQHRRDLTVFQSPRPKEKEPSCFESLFSCGKKK
jgi:hypothetical protein